MCAESLHLEKQRKTAGNIEDFFRCILCQNCWLILVKVMQVELPHIPALLIAIMGAFLDAWINFTLLIQDFPINIKKPTLIQGPYLLYPGFIPFSQLVRSFRTI